jgi:type II secretory pathway component PulF
MTKVLKYLAEEYEFLNKIRSQYIGAMIYPTLLFSVAIIAVFLLFTMILPGIFEMITTFPGVKIPAMTQFLITVTGFMSNNFTSILVRVTII